MRPSLVVLALTSLLAATAAGFAAPAAAQGYYGQPYSPGYRGEVPRARIWLDDSRDFYRRGDRLRILFSTSEDAYVAVVHIDPDGHLDFLYPDSPLDRDYVRGGETYSLPRRGFGGELVRGSSGVGYLYVIASPVPLDYGYFNGRGGYGWDWSYAGRQVYGDPFWALEQITRTLLPDYGYVPYGSDYASYYVGGRVRYPTYACGSSLTIRSGGIGFRTSWGYNPYYDSCDRLDVFLRSNPYYFDPYRYRGDRRVIYRGYGSWEPRHGYKAAPDVGRRAVPRAQANEPTRYRGAEDDRRAQPRQPQPAEPQQPAARRPTLERRPAEPQSRPATGERARGTTRTAEPSRQPSRASSSGKSGGSSPAPATPSRRRPGGG
jgi:hypothetical protein